MKNIASYIDHTLLRPTATPDEIKELCKEAEEHSFYAVCVQGQYVDLAEKCLQKTNVKIAAVVGFPLGANSMKTKVYEAKQAILDGADEIDMVISLGLLKAREYDMVRDEIEQIKQAIGKHVLKVIIETCSLTNEEKEMACQLAYEAGADFVKTSTGYGNHGATLTDIELMRNVVGDKMKIKASGGIRDRKTAEQYIAAGVDRIGTSSGVKIVTDK
ncbi:MAG TPA: deoxyribose-phosphate aldolase [Flavobacteriaceae bacterium]|nr:deoxyribose-phosphate aldolase [Flavobacteriaceae bacterium]